MANRVDNWIQGAIGHPGALRRTASHMGLVKGSESLSRSDLDKIMAQAHKSGNATLVRRVNLAKTLRKFH